MLGIARPWDSPLDRLTADRDIFQAGFNETPYFIHPEIRLHEFRTILIQLKQPVLVIAESEEIVFLGNQFGGPSAGRAIHRLRRVTDVSVVVDAVAALIFGFVDRTFLERQIFIALKCALYQSLDRAFVLGRGGANEIRNRDSQQLPQIAKDFLVLVDQLLRRDSGCLRCAFDVDAVLVGAGDVGNIVAAHAFVAGDDVADDGGVCRADVRARVGVIDGRREVILGFGIVHELFGPARNTVTAARIHSTHPKQASLRKAAASRRTRKVLRGAIAIGEKSRSFAALGMTTLFGGLRSEVQRPRGRREFYWRVSHWLLPCFPLASHGAVATRSVFEIQKWQRRSPVSAGCPFVLRCADSPRIQVWHSAPCRSCLRLSSALRRRVLRPRRIRDRGSCGGLRGCARLVWWFRETPNQSAVTLLPARPESLPASRDDFSSFAPARKIHRGRRPPEHARRNSRKFADSYHPRWFRSR